MSLAAEEFADRRRIRRGLRRWRVAAVVLAVLLVLALAWRAADGEAGVSGPHVARIDIEGVIGSNDRMLSLIESLGENDAVKAVVVHVDSPGGTAVGGEAHFVALRELAEKKPLVARVDTLAASAGYMIAAAADHIVARNTSIVGSIGVIVQIPNVSEALDRVGVEVRTIKSTPLKAEPSVATPVNPEAEEMMRRMVLSSYEWFVALVKERRDLDPNQLAVVTDGSVFSGRQSLDNGLIDAIGGEEVVEEYLKTRGLEDELPTLRYEPKRENTGFASLFGRAGHAFGAGLIEALNGASGLSDGIPVDGLKSLWQDAGSCGATCGHRFEN